MGTGFHRSCGFEPRTRRLGGEDRFIVFVQSTKVSAAEPRNYPALSATIMSFKKAQSQVDSWVKSTGAGYWKPHEVLATLVEEVGELSREISHQFGPKKKKESEAPNELSSEIADIFFVLICLSNSLNIDLDEAFSKTMKKVSTRDKNRWR